MKSIILAAGYATRLYPLTENQPKPLLPVAGKPMLNYIMEKIEEVSNIDEVFVVTNNKFFLTFVQWKANNEDKFTKKITIVNDKTKTNEDRLGAIGDIHYVIDTMNIDEELLVIAGDNLFEFSLGEFVDFAKGRSSLAVYDLKDKSKIANKFGCVELDEESKLIGFEEKPSNPKTTLASTACYFFTKDDVELLENCIKENNKPDNTGDFIQYLSEKKDVFGFVFDEKWFDIGGKEEYEEVNKIYS